MSGHDLAPLGLLCLYGGIVLMLLLRLLLQLRKPRNRRTGKGPEIGFRQNPPTRAGELREYTTRRTH